MNHSSSPTFLCRHCRYYAPQGRRGGHCNKLNVTVKSRWEACSLVASPFTSAWKEFGDIMLWPQKVLELQEAIVGHGNERIDEERTESSQPVPAIAVGSERT